MGRDVKPNFKPATTRCGPAPAAGRVPGNERTRATCAWC